MSMPDWGIAAVPVIAVICFLIGEAVKLAPINKDWIPWKLHYRLPHTSLDSGETADANCTEQSA